MEALGIKPKKDTLKHLYAGMLDDLQKSSCVKIKTENGVSTLERTKELSELPDRKNVIGVLDNVEEELGPNEKNNVIKSLGDLSTLTEKEEKYRESLFKDIKFINENKPEDKIAYIIIPPDDKDWDELRTSNIRNAVVDDVKLRLLANSSDDEAISAITKQLENIKAVIVYHPDGKPNKSGTLYKQSLTAAKGKNALKIIEPISGNISSLEEKLEKELGFKPELRTSGQEKRAGVWVDTKDPKDCKSFVDCMVDSLNNKD